MNEYDDLFKDSVPDKPESLAPTAIPIKQLEPLPVKPHVNGAIIIVYFVAMLLVELLFNIYATSKFPDQEMINEGIIVVSEPSIQVTPVTDDDVYPYQVTFDAVLKNTNDMILPRIWIQYELLDADGESFYTFYADKSNIGYNETTTFSESVDLSSEPITYSYTYGFELSALFYILRNLSSVMLAAVIAVWIDRLHLAYDWKRVKSSGIPKYLGQVAIGFAMVYAAMIAAQVIMISVFKIESNSQNEIMIGSMFSDDPLRLILLFFSLCIFAPVIEELVFRKVIYGFFERHLGYVLAIVGSGLIFGLMHVVSYGDFIQAIPYVFMGSIFGYVYYRSGKNIYVTIGVHFINNLISYLLYFYTVMQ